ncbi:hypothetical protein EJ06DRAFT_475828 [Trichodelitschia bisporula]|uniref:EthD domain-containing protein n=1 Tax=Trichodelitschia bisporula TaxID=703511 RepID=A0A6G1HZS7_9PEZI|nr:hypothetical protein EJ06DRAFT_475828 [Trichodelitschia bisporula]
MESHTFNFEHLKPGKGSNEQPYLRLLMFFHKLPHITEEQFHEWWKTVHADLTVSAKDFGVYIQRYVQFHSTSAHKEMVRPLGYEILSFDACGEMHARKMEDWVNFSKSQHFVKALMGMCSTCTRHDAPNFMQLPIHIMAGYDNLIFGSKIEASGSDGILPGNPRLN